mmetsp:Transcript_15325/g.17835  ORF Transcript_15325/g.17835 Transcript_15325/m.17835 type:complete len:499 (+) Transcript_15325:61-1557(+)
MAHKKNSSKDDFPVHENARAVCHRNLPPVKPEHRHDGAILLFYQYIEPIWTKTEHKKALKKVIEIATKNNITGRGRVAQEGLNCTLTGKPDDIRSFCYGLREWQDIFNETDFKITDGTPFEKLFKSLSIKKANELVAYGLAGDKAPSLKKFAGTHLEADEYHKAMQDPDAVVIDVRNAYESTIGAFKPPESGATLIDPKMRNSVEFPKWLNSKETQERINGKKVLMYCTGGIRCERATALLNQMSEVMKDLKPKGVYHCRGGIERYVKTFPQGGYWKGKNYLFDRRMEQTPDIKSPQKVEQDIDSKCVLCRTKWTVYRGQFKCNRSLCRVPVIVCESCTITASEKPETLVCELCREGYRAPSELPDLVRMKRKADEMVNKSQLTLEKDLLLKKPKKYYKDRIFVRRLPLTITFTKIKAILGDDNISAVQWLTDHNSGGFYGSCVVRLSSFESMKLIMEKIKHGIKVDKKKIKVAEVFIKENQDPFNNFVQMEYPPVGS